MWHDARVMPYIDMSVKGWVWYQGENDMHNLFGAENTILGAIFIQNRSFCQDRLSGHKHLATLKKMGRILHRQLRREHWIRLPAGGLGQAVARAVVHDRGHHAS